MQRRQRAVWSELVGQCRRGDEEAWRRLVELITPLVFSICRRMRLSREETFDVLGHVCYQLLQHLGKLRSADKLLGYVSSITRHEVYAIERRGRLFTELALEQAGDPADNSRPLPDELLDASRRSERLMKAMARLPRRDYELLHLLFLDRSRPSYEEIARRLHMPVSSIGPTRQRSLAKLRRLLEQAERGKKK